MSRKSAKRKAKAAKPKGTAPSDWSAVPELDPSLLETGLYKFAGDAENRSQDRISHRELGLVDIALQAPGSHAWTKVRLWDFTSISFGVVDEASGEAAWPAPAGLESALSAPERSARLAARKQEPTELATGDEVRVRLRLHGQSEFEVWCQVRNRAEVKDGIKFGLRRLDVGFPQAVESDRREAARLPVAPTLALNARIKHPFIYGHWCALSVSDVNRDMGFSFTSADPSVLLFEGMELKIHFELASFRSVPMIARVTWVHATEANQVKFGAACLDMPWRLHNGICDYMLFSRQWSPARLRQAGFRAQRVKGRLRFRSVRSMDDYAEVLYLRRDAYVGAGKRLGATRPEDMAGKLDGQSRILMAHHGDKLVGTLTFTFPTKEDTILDSQAGFPGGRYPVPLPPKANLIEVSRLCIHEDYRSTDLLQGLFEHGVKHFLMSDRHWLLTSATADLLPLYQRIGFRKIGASYKHPQLNFLEHHLILARLDSFLWGRGMNLLVWNALFGDLIAYLLRRKLISAPWPIRAIIRAKRALAPLSRWVAEGSAEKAFRKHLDALRRERIRIQAMPERPPMDPETVPDGASAGATPEPPESAGA